MNIQKLLVGLCLVGLTSCGGCDPETRATPKSASGVTKTNVQVPVGSDGLTTEQRNIKERLLRDKDGNELLCAACLAPGKVVDDKGKYHETSYGMYTDQVNGWLPAIPTDDTYWGYSSSPSQDVEWWQNLPTYKKDK